MAFIDDTIEVDADVRTVYDLWTAFEEFPAFMDVVERIDIVSEDGLHWVAVVDDDIVEWDADVVEHIEDQSVSWRAVDGRETGKVMFDKTGANTTKVHYELEYDPALWSDDPDKMHRWMRRRVDKDLKAFKSFIEEDI